MRYPIAYIYKHSPSSSHISVPNELREEVEFISDENGGLYLYKQLCGCRYRGIVFSGEAKLYKEGLEFLLTRIYTDNKPVFIIDDYHKKLITSVLEDQYDGAYQNRDPKGMKSVYDFSVEMGVATWFNSLEA